MPLSAAILFNSACNSIGNLPLPESFWVAALSKAAALALDIDIAVGADVDVDVDVDVDDMCEFP